MTYVTEKKNVEPKHKSCT